MFRETQLPSEADTTSQLSQWFLDAIKLVDRADPQGCVGTITHTFGNQERQYSKEAKQLQYLVLASVLMLAFGAELSADKLATGLSDSYLPDHLSDRKKQSLSRKLKSVQHNIIKSQAAHAYSFAQVQQALRTSLSHVGGDDADATSHLIKALRMVKIGGNPNAYVCAQLCAQVQSQKAVPVMDAMQARTLLGGKQTSRPFSSEMETQLYLSRHEAEIMVALMPLFPAVCASLAQSGQLKWVSNPATTVALATAARHWEPEARRVRDESKKLSLDYAVQLTEKIQSYMLSSQNLYEREQIEGEERTIDYAKASLEHSHQYMWATSASAHLIWYLWASQRRERAVQKAQLELATAVAVELVKPVPNSALIFKKELDPNWQSNELLFLFWFFTDFISQLYMIDPTGSYVASILGGVVKCFKDQHNEGYRIEKNVRISLKYLTTIGLDVEAFSALNVILENDDKKASILEAPWYTEE